MKCAVRRILALSCLRRAGHPAFFFFNPPLSQFTFICRMGVSENSHMILLPSAEGHHRDRLISVFAANYPLVKSAESNTQPCGLWSVHSAERSCLRARPLIAPHARDWAGLLGSHTHPEWRAAVFVLFIASVGGEADKYFRSQNRQKLQKSYSLTIRTAFTP